MIKWFKNLFAEVEDKVFYKDLYLKSQEQIREVEKIAFNWKFKYHYPKVTNVESITVNDGPIKYTLGLIVENGTTTNPVTGQVYNDVAGSILFVPCVALFPDDAVRFEAPTK